MIIDAGRVVLRPKRVGPADAAETPNKDDKRAGKLDDHGAQQGPIQAPSACTVLLGPGNAQVRRWGAWDSNPQPTD